jgi:YhcH/YjgK/YiaL family protein
MQPDPSINERELAIQYHRHQSWWDTAFAYMKKGEYSHFTPGNTALQGDDVFVKATAYNTKDPADAFYEVHRNYADIHFVVSGEEYIGNADLENAKPRAAYDTVKDIRFYDAAEGEQCMAKPGVFFIFFPGEAHRPGVRTGESAPVKKIVIKVRS